MERCFAGLCFHALDPNSPKLFGFSELLAGLALIVLAWTIADVRYRFRVRTAPVPLQPLTFAVVAAIGVLTLLTDLWRAEGWLVPKGDVLTPASWQAILAGLFLGTFLSWTWFAFINPPKFGKRNAERYALTLYRYILRGSPTELAVIADEISYSARSLVRHATDRGMHKYVAGEVEAGGQSANPTNVEAYANDLLLLIADRRLCRAIVEFSPVTALLIFQEMGDAKKYGIRVEAFAKNIVNEAFINKESFLYHETDGYESGLMGYHRPLSQAMFSNHALVETVGTMLDPQLDSNLAWDAKRWEAYCRVVLMTLRDYLNNRIFNHSFVLRRATGYIEQAVSDLYKLNGVTSTWETDSVRRLRVVVNFIKDAVSLLEFSGRKPRVCLRIRGDRFGPHRSFHDEIAQMISEVVFHASAVTSPQWECWSIQHNCVWGGLFNYHHLDSVAGRIVKFKLRRILYDEVANMRAFPNFKGAKILAFCLNVMGLKLLPGRSDRDSRALHKVILSWTKNNYAWLHNYNPLIAQACLVDGLSFDIRRCRIVKTYQVDALRRKPEHIYLDLNSDSVQTSTGKHRLDKKRRRGGR